MTRPNPALLFNPTFQQLVCDVHKIVQAVETATTGKPAYDIEEMADDLGTSPYWIEMALDWLALYGPNQMAIFVESDPDS